MTRRAVFLDRDGTVIVERHYLGDPAGVELMPRAAEGLAAWIRGGYRPVIVSNQSGVARGRFTLRDLARVNRRMEDLLRERGVRLAGIYCCPHHPDLTGPCSCRKPRPGLLARAAFELGLDLGASVMIGDSERDAEAGRRAGCRALVLGRDAADLLDAWRRVTGRASGRPSPTRRPRP